MGDIRVLPRDLVNRIAAGEVIERPASVVKELVENALDAGAKRIRIDLEEGGAKLIRVSDDGCGMDEDDLKLAFASHATSKLETAEDLFQVTTLGFRGEALASIGAVSRSRIVSRRRGSAGGWSIDCDGGEVSSLSPSGSAEGTTVEVRQLFHNTPARRKFLKAPSTEMSALTETVERLVVPNPGVGFELRHNGREILAVAPEISVRERIGAIFGRELESSLLPFEFATGEISGLGFCAPPSQSRPRADATWFFLNGRPIRDRGLAHACLHAYRELLPPGRYAVAFTLLRVRPDSVDVNVHPTKSEVRFQRPGVVHDAVAAALRRALGEGPGLSTEIRPAPRASAPSNPADWRGTGTSRDAVREAADLFGASADGFFFKPRAGETAARDDSRPAEPTRRERTATGRAMQVHSSYIVVETQDGVAILDQHALHEGVQHHRIEEAVRRGPLPPQRLLVPEIVELRPGEPEVLESLQPELERFGLHVDLVSEREAAVRAVPSGFPSLRAAEFLRDSLARAREGHASPEAPLARMIDSLACRSAVTAGTPLSPAMVEELVRLWQIAPHAATCAHARPSALRIKLSELERWFLRK